MLKTLLAVTMAGSSPLLGQEACWAGTTDMIGQRGGDRVIQKSFGGLRVCVMGRDLSTAYQLPPGDWPRSSSRVTLETILDGRVHRMRLTADSTAFERDGGPRAIDSIAAQWRAALTDVLNATWQLERLRSRDTAQRDGVVPSSGQGGAAQGIVHSVPGELGAMRAELSSLKAQWQTLDGEIRLLREEAARLHADLRSEQSSMSQAQSRLATADARERAAINREIQRYSREIARLNGAIQRIEMQAGNREGQLASLNVAARIARLDRQIRELGSTERTPVADEPAKDLDVEQRVAEVDRLLQAEVARSTRDLEAFIQAALQRLRAAIRAD